MDFSSSLDFFPPVSQGKIAAQGIPSDLLDHGIEFVTMANSDTEGQDKLRSMPRSQSQYSVKSDSAGIPYDLDDDNEQSEEVAGVQLEASSKGTAKGSNAINYFRAGAHWPALVLLVLSFLIAQVIVCAADIWIAIW